MGGASPGEESFRGRGFSVRVVSVGGVSVEGVSVGGVSQWESLSLTSQPSLCVHYQTEICFYPLLSIKCFCKKVQLMTQLQVVYTALRVCVCAHVCMSSVCSCVMCATALFTTECSTGRIILSGNPKQ